MTAQAFATIAELALSTTPADVNAAHVLGSLTVGDDGDAILLKVATPAIIKPWHKPSNNAWFELMSTVGTLKFFGGLSSGSTGNNSANNQALKDIAQWVAERKEAGCSAEITFHPGIYDYNDSAFNLAQQSLSIRSIGQPILRYHGSGNALILDGLADNTHAGFRALRMIGQLTVQSNSAADDAIVVRSLHDSDLDLCCGGGNSTKAGLRLEFGVCSRIKYACSSNYLTSGAPWWSGGVAPQYGAYVTKLNPDLAYITPNSFCTLYPVIEGVPYGIWAADGNGLQIEQGTVEGCSITALTINFGSSKINVNGTAFEANGSQGIYCVGTDCMFVGIDCDIFTFGTNGIHAGARNRIIGGHCERIICEAASAYNQIATTYNLTGSGGLTDNGQFNKTEGSFDSANQQYTKRARTTLTVSGSPFTFQNTTGDNLLVSVTGGGTTAIDLQPRVTGSYFSAGVTAGVFGLAPKDNIKITYSGGAPTVNQWGV